MPRLTLVPGIVVESWRDAEIEGYFRDSYRIQIFLARSVYSWPVQVMFVLV
jgi:hypothetical protein